MVRLSLFVVLLGCAPELEDRVTLVEAPRVLAVRATPAEAMPGETVTVEALFVDAKGTRVDPVRWSLCVDRKPLAEAGTIASSCLTTGVPFSAALTVPTDACRQFGPERPEPKPGEPSGRPSDPDATGGYYQPFRIDAGSSVTFGELRIRCGLAGATQEQSVDFALRNKPNANPKIVGLDAPSTAARGSVIDLRVAWDAAETYPYFDPVARAIVDRREAIRVSWYANAGAFGSERTGRASDDRTLDSSNTWRAPSSAGDVTLWVVVRDDRGGVDFRALTLKVQ